MSVRSKKAGKVQPTEGKNSFSQRIDGASALKIARILNREDRKVALAVRAQLREIARAIEIVEESLSRGGRLFYVGAGTSGWARALSLIPPVKTAARTGPWAKVSATTASGGFHKARSPETR